MSITLAEIRTQARQRADMENSQFVADAELNSYINKSIAELHDLLTQSYGSDYFVSEYDFNTQSGVAAYNLPADYFKLTGVDATINGSDYMTVEKFNFNERNRFSNIGTWSLAGLPAVRYRVMGNQIRFSPTPDATVAVKLWYTPTATKLVNDSDVLNDFNQWSEYVIVDAAIKMKQKEESDVQVEMAEKTALIKRIQEASQNRDAANPESIADIYAEDNDFYFRG